MSDKPLSTDEQAELTQLMGTRTDRSIRSTHGGEHGGHSGCRTCDLIARKLHQRPFPIQKSVSVPWAIAREAYITYARRYGTNQTLERLAQRGGFSADEMDDLYPEWRFASMALRSKDERIAELEQEMEDRDNQWREASGLNVGGDPGDVEPETLRRYVQDADATLAKMAEWIAALLRSDQTWSLSETLGRLVLATDHLLVDHDCDAIGHEGIRQAQTAAREVMATIGRVVRSGAAGETDGGEGVSKPVVTITDEKLAELKRGAKDATPGPWVFKPDGAYGNAQVCSDDVRSLALAWDLNAKHIAACDPPTILALVAEVCRLRTKEAGNGDG